MLSCRARFLNRLVFSTPVHSIGAALFAKKEQIVFFEDIGYTHNPFSMSPFF